MINNLATLITKLALGNVAGRSRAILMILNKILGFYHTLWKYKEQ